MAKRVHFYNLALQRELAEQAKSQADKEGVSFTSFICRSIKLGLFLLSEQERGAKIIFKDGNSKETEIRIL